VLIEAWMPLTRNGSSRFHAQADPGICFAAEFHHPSPSIMITEKDPVQHWPMDHEQILRKREGRTVLITVLMLLIMAAISFYALSRNSDEPPRDLPKAERVTGPAAL
jgi:hypothetical protein